MADASEYSEVSQLRTRCTILESQIQILEKQNSELKQKLTHIHPDFIGSNDQKIKAGWKEVPNIGTFPKDDDGTFQV